MVYQTPPIQDPVQIEFIGTSAERSFRGRVSNRTYRIGGRKIVVTIERVDLDGFLAIRQNRQPAFRLYEPVAEDGEESPGTPIDNGESVASSVTATVQGTATPTDEGDEPPTAGEDRDTNETGGDNEKQKRPPRRSSKKTGK